MLHRIKPTMTPQMTWEQIQPSLKDLVGSSAYESWFSSIRVINEDLKIILETPDDFFKTWIVDHYLLKTLDIEYLRTVSFILVIASLVQFVEMFLK